MASTTVDSMDGVGLLPRPAEKTTLLISALIPAACGGSTAQSSNDGDRYIRRDVLLREGKIAALEPAYSKSSVSSAFDENERQGMSIIDCTEKMLLPGFVNAHTHSSEHWSHGLIPPLPLELWVLEQIRHDPRGPCGWHGPDSFEQTPAQASIGASALHCGVEALLSGCTAILDHLYVRHLDDIAAAVHAYKALGIRAFVAPMLSDDAVLLANYIPLVHDAEARNEQCKSKSNNDDDNNNCCCGGLRGMGADGSFRSKAGDYDDSKTTCGRKPSKSSTIPPPALKLSLDWSPSTHFPRALAGRRPLAPEAQSVRTHARAGNARASAHGLAILSFPVGRPAFARHGLFGQELARHQLCRYSSADRGGIRHSGRTRRHVCAQSSFESAPRIGCHASRQLFEAGRQGGRGLDGSCSSDGQDMLEALKLETIASAISKPDYREWLTAEQVALTMASKNGYSGIGMEGQAGTIE